MEAQNQISTMKLVDNTDEQELLEHLIEDTKPVVPEECRHLDYLLFSPFRYSKYPSRFRRANALYGVFYAAEHVETALAEIVFHRLLRFGDAPATPWPTNPVSFTAFAAEFDTESCLDLTQPPHDSRTKEWAAPEDYTSCQNLAEQALEAGVDVIRSFSLRDPGTRHNISLLTCRAFSHPAPTERYNWRVRFSQTGVQARALNPAKAITFAPGSFDEDPRMQDYPWVRSTA